MMVIRPIMLVINLTNDDGHLMNDDDNIILKIKRMVEIT